ncbi:MAG: cell wall metabolism sensor histidine kinase WalK [Saccharofermentans sp.]|nr:cell wall metabolism sensor histidine kinase WalK [Saccharofermentans sp.]
MFRSNTLMKRIVILVFGAVVASTFLAVVAFNLAGRQITFQNEIDDAFEHSKQVTEIIYNTGDMSLEDMSSYILATANTSGYTYFFTGEDAVPLFREDFAPDSKNKIIAQEYLLTYMNSDVQPTNETINISYAILDTSSVFNKILLIKTPMEINGKNVFLIQYSVVKENSELISQYLNILLLSALAASLIMIMPTVLLVERITEPLQEVNEVAKSYGKGDFSQRANENHKGEVGELANSFNSMADKLSVSINSLTAERNRLEEIFNVISEGIVVFNDIGNVTFTNNIMNSFFDKVPKRNLFTERLHLIPFEEIWKDIDDCISEGESKSRVVEVMDFAFKATIVPRFDITNTEECVGATAFFHDISDELKMEKTRRDYVANISHELRTPLQTLRGLIEPLSDGMVKKEEDRQRYYNIILNETLRLSRLIDDMLELSKLQSGTLAFKTFPFDLNRLLDDLETKFMPVMSEAEIDFGVTYHTGKLPTVMGNPDRVEQILIILLDNAKKYTPAGKSIRIVAEYDENVDKVLISVSDTGQGIHEFDINHIFDRFFKADRARGKKGTGLGLSIAKELLNYMGETITVQSEYGHGTTFTFTLKRAEANSWFDE